MGDSPENPSPEPLTCFVAMGFGKKTDFETGRVLDLDASYRNLIKPAVEEAGLKCVRADEIIHAGMIDVPMYEQLFGSDVVIADLSTSNRNAIYELGVRHALRPYTTIVIAEEGLLSSKFFDLSHIVIRKYRHLGEDIGASETRRFQGELVAAIREILKKMPENRQDSPVYTFLKELTPPFFGKKAFALAAAKAVSPAADGQADAPCCGEIMAKVDEAVKREAWSEAKILLQEMRTLQKAGADKTATARPEDPYLLQRLALATYKSQEPSLIKALMEAIKVLEPLDPSDSGDPETLGLWGSIHKQLWELSRDPKDLHEAIHAHERGFFIRNDHYNGINFAFLLNARAKETHNSAEAITDFILAKRIRRKVTEICRNWLQANPGLTGPAVPAWQKDKHYWILATLAEAAIGLGDEQEGSAILAKAYALGPADWMKQSTVGQLAKLRGFLAASPLDRIKD